RIEQVHWRMLLAEASAFHDPLDVQATRNVPADPHQKDHHHADGEGEAEIIMRVLAPTRDRGERVCSDKGQDQLPTERDVQSREREDDEAGCRHPMHEPLKGGEAHHDASRPAMYNFHLTYDEIQSEHHGAEAEDS